MITRLTEKDQLVQLHNEVLSRLVRNRLNVKYWKGWAQKLRKGPDHSNAIKNEAGLYVEIEKDEFFLQIIREELKDYGK